MGEDPATVKLPLHAPLPAIADEAFDRIAALVRTVLGVPVALVSLVDRDRQVFPGAVGLPEPSASDRQTPLTHSFCQHVVVQAAPLVVDDARTHPLVADNLAIRDLGVIAYAGMPIVDLDGRVAGSLCAIDVTPRTWTGVELDLLADLAAACSAELQLRIAAVRAAEVAGRSRMLLELSEALSVTTSVVEVSRTVGGLAGSRLGAHFAGIMLLDEHLGVLRCVDLGDLPEAAPTHTVLSLATDSPPAVAARLRRPVFAESLDELDAFAPDVRASAGATGGRSFAYLPLQIGRRVLGTLGLTWSEPRVFDANDRELLHGLARYTAQAVDRALLLAERRDAAHTLQAALLPTLPTVGWLEIAGRYHPANTADAVGGDWYDAFATADGSLTVAVGDVTGHDSAAAAAMGQLQASLRALAIDAPGAPSVLLTRLERVMDRLPDRRLATVVAATLTRAAGGGANFTWSNAGHLSPLVLVPGRPAAYLDRGVDRLLGLGQDSPRSSHDVVLPAGTSLLLFTDGLVERRTSHLQDGLDALVYAADLHRELPLPDLLDTLVTAALAAGHDDDTVLFGVRLPSVPAS